MNKVWTVICASVLVVLVASAPRAQQNQMSFFVTSAGSGMGGNLGGLDGADKTLSDAGKGSRRRPARGGHISARKEQAPSTRGIASARDRGGMRRGWSLPRTSTIFTAPRPT